MICLHQLHLSLFNLAGSEHFIESSHVLKLLIKTLIALRLSVSIEITHVSNLLDIDLGHLILIILLVDLLGPVRDRMHNS